MECKFGKDTKKTQQKKGSSHNCRIDETIQLDVQGHPETGVASSVQSPTHLSYAVLSSSVLSFVRHYIVAGAKKEALLAALQILTSLAHAGELNDDDIILEVHDTKWWQSNFEVH